MTDLVDPTAIEQIVGARRLLTQHQGRAVDDEQRFYILHSQLCVDERENLRDCPFSRALDEHGIQHWPRAWRNQPVYLDLRDGRLVPRVSERMMEVERIKDAMMERSSALVEAFSGSDPTEVVMRGIPISYSVVPTFQLEAVDGGRIEWREDLCRMAPPGTPQSEQGMVYRHRTNSGRDAEAATLAAVAEARRERDEALATLAEAKALLASPTLRSCGGLDIGDDGCFLGDLVRPLRDILSRAPAAPGGEHGSCARTVEYGQIRYACGVDVPVGTPNAYEAHVAAATAPTTPARTGRRTPAAPERDFEPLLEPPHGPGIADMARRFSLWLNSTYPPDLPEEAVFWRRVGKISEEAGEVRTASGAYWHENPRKPAGPIEDVIKELADCVGAALGAIEHLTGHEGRSLDIATERVRFVCERVGIAVDAPVDSTAHHR